MFYQFDDELTTINIDEINRHLVSAGYLTGNSIDNSLAHFGISKRLDYSQDAGAIIEADEYYIEIALTQINNERLNIFVTKSTFIVVDVNDGPSNSLELFMATLKRYSPSKVSVARLCSAFIDSILSRDWKTLEQIGVKITQLEEIVLNDNTDNDFSLELLKIKKHLLQFLSFYNQLLSAEELLIDEADEILNDDLKCLDALHLRTQRIKTDINALQGAVVHLQETYSAFLDLKLNQTMKGFTVITTIFFPLTVIASWYGMNFKFMPEISWRWGYIFAICLSVFIILLLLIIGKRKKWL